MIKPCVDRENSNYLLDMIFVLARKRYLYYLIDLLTRTFSFRHSFLEIAKHHLSFPSSIITFESLINETF
jgi:hypothetical protein